ncbi:MAG: TylF/MycF/NovP-related O-methyltransferase [Planctomycetota bacterium]|jgi:hypothetical protein
MNFETKSVTSTTSNKPLAIRIMRRLSMLLPGDYFKTVAYMNFIAKPRKLLNQFLNGFYRIDHIYEVIKEAKILYRGDFSILEFGSADGYAFIKMLYATKHLVMTDRIVVHAFDTFEGMPEPKDAGDLDLIVGDSWAEGQFPGRYKELVDYCKSRYTNYCIHKGYFEDTLIPELLDGLKSKPPILIWIDCDYYSSTRVVFEKLIPLIPSGCVVYFDDFELLNYGSRFTGEAKFVAELNRGVFGNNIELVLDKKLSRDSNRCYRFIRCDSGPQYEPVSRRHSSDLVRRRTNGSALP